MREQIVSSLGSCGKKFLSVLGLRGNKMMDSTGTIMVNILGLVSALCSFGNKL
jgi:hypothetical protein